MAGRTIPGISMLAFGIRAEKLKPIFQYRTYTTDNKCLP